MTQEDLKQIKALRDEYEGSSFTYNLLTKLISTVEELQQIPSLIEQIFKAGGDLSGLSHNVYWNVEYGHIDEEGWGMPFEEFDTLKEALEFILQRTTK